MGMRTDTQTKKVNAKRKSRYTTEFLGATIKIYKKVLGKNRDIQRKFQEKNRHIQRKFQENKSRYSKKALGKKSRYTKKVGGTKRWKSRQANPVLGTKKKYEWTWRDQRTKKQRNS